MEQRFFLLANCGRLITVEADKYAQFTFKIHAAFAFNVI